MNALVLHGTVLAVHVVLVGAAVLLLGLGVRPLVRRLHPRAQALLWSALFLAALAGPFAARVAGVDAPAPVAPAPSATTAPENPAPSTGTAVSATAPAVPSAEAPGPGGRAEATERAAPVPASRARLPSGVWAWAVVGVWVFGAAVLLARIGIGIRRVRRLKVEGTPLSHPGVEAAWAAAGPGRRASVLVSPRVRVPTAVGWLRPAVLVPPFVAEGVSSPDLGRLLLHEIAHLRLGHDWAKLIQELLSALFFFSPALPLLSRELAQAREGICDLWAVKRTGSARVYARVLLRLGRLAARLGPVQAAQLGLPSSYLRRRIAVLRSEAVGRPYRRARALLGGALAGVGIVAAVAALPPVLVFSERGVAWASPGPWRQVAGFPAEPFTYASLSGHGGIPVGLAFSPRGDLLATAEHGTNVVRLWDVRTLREVRTLFRPVPTRTVVGGLPVPLAFSPDGRLLAAAGADPSSYPTQIRNKVYIWDVDRGEVVAEFSTGDLARDAAFSPDGLQLAVALWGELTVWSVQDGSEVLKVRDGRSWERVVWSPDGRLLALGARSPVEATARDVTLWDVRTGERVATLGSAGPEVAFSPGGEYLAFPAWGGEVWLVALATGDVVLRRPAHPDGPAAFAPDGTLIARAPDGSLRAWQVPGGEPVWTLPGAGGPRLAVHPAGRIVAVATGYDLTVRLWDVVQGEPVGALPGHWATGLLAASPRSGRVAVRAGAEVTLWEPPFEGPVRTLPHPGQVSALAWDPTGNLLAAGVRGEVHLWDARTGERRVLPGRGGEVLRLAFSPDGRTLAAGGGDPAVVLWDLERGEVRTVLPQPEGRVISLAFSPDGRTVAVPLGVTTPVMLTLWDAATGEKWGEYPDHGVWAAFRPDGTLVTFRTDPLRGSLDLVVLDPASGEARVVVEHGYRYPLDLDPTGRYLAAGGWIEDPDLRVLDLEAGEWVVVIPTGVVGGAAFGAHGLLFVSGTGTFPSLGALAAFHLGGILKP